jgi:hypothetical protein
MAPEVNHTQSVAMVDWAAVTHELFSISAPTAVVSGGPRGIGYPIVQTS